MQQDHRPAGPLIPVSKLVEEWLWMCRSYFFTSLMKSVAMKATAEIAAKK